MASKSKRKYYAKVSQPLIEAAVNGLFKFDTKEAACAKLEDFKKTYHLSKEQPEQTSDLLAKLRLWIADYAVEEEEVKKGYCGHYALLKVQQGKGGKWTIVAEKEVTEIKAHPHKKFPKKKNVGWSHPIMRAIKRGKKFDDAGTAQNVLDQLHEEYPETTVPGLGKLNAIVYERQEEKGIPPVTKYKFTIKEVEIGEGKPNKFVIEAFKDPKNKSAPAPKKPQGEIKGSFTAMVAQKRNTKRKKVPAQSDSRMPEISNTLPPAEE